MKVIGLNNREYTLDIKKYIVYDDDKRVTSAPHKQARELLREIYSSYNILEEVKLPGSRDPSKKSVLFLDFFIAPIMMAVEIHGRQHYEHVPFFHKTKADFLQAKRRDEIKKQWCEINNIELIVLKYDEHKQWKQQLTNFG